MRDRDQSRCASRRFVLDDGSLDDTVVLYNMPERMGLDVAFMVSSAPMTGAVGAGAARAGAAGSGSASPAASAHRDFRVVGLHFNNTANSLADVMLTLHPGTQLLTNTQREALLSCRGFTRALGGGGAGSADWLDFMAFAAEQPQLATDWIRVPVVARPVHSHVYKFAGQLAAGALDRRFLERFTWTAARRGAAARSPVVIASLHAEACLPVDGSANATAGHHCGAVSHNTAVYAVSTTARRRLRKLSQCVVAAGNLFGTIARQGTRQSGLLPTVIDLRPTSLSSIAGGMPGPYPGACFLHMRSNAT